ncbi:leucine carboxyl methyltransferase [Xylariales sp. AK1849]|nr:leucine carboxyl methyltransferase [Xylariales sp. AK1849]
MAPKSTQKLQGRSVKARAQDDLVMSTNSSSIVSKRSVERIYYPDEPHFFRFFVKKFQRRSPLINRGYHLRLHVIDVAVRNFLKRPSVKTKVIINLGAGFDVLPWQCLTRYPELCKGAKFVDLDFPDLMTKKRRVVQETPELSSALSGVKASEDPLVLLQSDQYIQIGCDLRELGRIEQSLSKVVSILDSEFMFIAEVSITYMETKAADAVIKWASTLGQAKFCLLEQILPDGADHPFAETMLRHFEKLNTPLRSVFSYPDLQAQKDRFTHLGWSHVDVETLWNTWSSSKYLSSEYRQKLNEVEPFDEWEEFAIFGSHYCVVIASTKYAKGPTETNGCAGLTLKTDNIPRLSAVTELIDHGRPCRRRFGASMILENCLGEQFPANVFGLGNNSRLKSLDLYATGPSRGLNIPSAGPPSRMCHAIVNLDCHGNLLIGGRASPSSPFTDCWLFDKARCLWQKIDDLPVPLYRHAATRLGNSSLALVVGGKTGSSSVFRGCLLYHPESGWDECVISGPSHIPVFGAMLACIHSSPLRSDVDESSAVIEFNGILAGGLLEDGTNAKQALRWKLKLSESERPSISFFSLTTSNDVKSGTQSDIVNRPKTLLDRFGASAILDKNGHLLVLGGIIEDSILPRELEVMLVDMTKGSESNVLAAGVMVQSQGSEAGRTTRPLLLGISLARTRDGEILMMGGGATCFSMGTYWNNGCCSLTYNVPSQKPTVTWIGPQTSWRFNQTFELTDDTSALNRISSDDQASQSTLVPIPRIRLESPRAFADVLKAGKPVIIEDADLGTCVQTWTPEHLVAKLGSDRKVVVHEATTAKMDFNTRNFSYVTKEFGPFMSEVGKGGKMYLRALSEDGPADEPTILSRDFPGLAAEFRLPPEMALVTDNTFSSVLRISGPVNMWLHYDVMANVYCQVVGAKRLILFPPTDVTQLSFAPGASSSSLEVLAELDSPSLANTHPHEAILQPGDVLFLPPLWLHAAAPLTSPGVAVNVFFRNLESGYSSGRDVYGNRDLAAYEKGRQDVSRIANSFAKVAPDMKAFYVRRLADELRQKLQD